MKSIDLYPYLPEFQINGTNGYKTRVGGLITSLITVGVTLASIAFCREIFEKANPIVMNSINYEEMPTIEKGAISLFLAPLLPAGLLIKEANRYFKYTLNMANSDSQNTTRPPVLLTDFNLEPCNNTSLYTQKDVFRSFLYSEMDYYHCLAAGDIENLEDLAGSYGGVKLVNWNIIVSPCVNTTDNNNFCKSEEEITQILKIFYVHFIIADTLVDSMNLETPLRSIYTSRLMRTSSFNSRDDVIFLTPISYTTDTGFILEDKTEQTGYQISRKETDSLYVNNVNFLSSYMLKVKLTLEKQKIIYKRSYVKIQTIAANIGGLAKFLILVLSYIAIKYNHINFLKYLSNQVMKPSTLQSKRAIGAKLNVVDPLKNNFVPDSKGVICSNKVAGNSAYEMMIKHTTQINSPITINQLTDTRLKCSDYIRFIIGCSGRLPSVLISLNNHFNFHFKIEKLFNLLLQADAESNN